MSPPPPRGARARLVSLLVVAALTAAGCTAAGAADAPPVVRVLGSFGGQEQVAFEQVLAAFQADTGILVEYEVAGDVPEELEARRTAAEGNDDPGATPGEGADPLPDVVVVSGTDLADLVEGAHVRALDGVIDTAALDASLVPALRDQGTVAGARWGVPLRATVDSLVWYRPDVFTRRGYEVPSDYAQLVALLDQIQADGDAPWCAGVESAQETGWVLTDWFEDLLLRTAGPDAYDAWIARDLPFDSPEVTRAAELFDELVLRPGRVPGGRLALLTTPYQAAPAGAFETPPTCVLHRQGTLAGPLYAGVREEDPVEPGTDVDVFAFPPVDDRWGRPLVGATDVAALVSGNAAAERLIAHLATPAAGERWFAADTDAPLLSPHAGFDPAGYPDDALRAQAEILADATTFRPDASEAMPEWLGGYAFHWELIDWVYDQQDLAEALRDIEGARPPLIDRPDAFPTEPEVGG